MLLLLLIALAIFVVLILLFVPAVLYCNEYTYAFIHTLQFVEAPITCRVIFHPLTILPFSDFQRTAYGHIAPLKKNARRTGNCSQKQLNGDFWGDATHHKLTFTDSIAHKLGHLYLALAA